MGATNILHFLSASTYNNKIIFFLVCSLIVALIVDTSIIKVYYFSFNQSPTDWRIILFIVISFVYLFGLYMMSEFVKKRSEEIRKRQMLRINPLHKMVIISQCLLAAIIIFVIFQIIIMQYYNVILLTASIWISYITAIIIMGVLAQHFFSWFKSNRNSVVFLYGLSSAILAVNAAFIVTFVTVILRNAPEHVLAHIAVGYPFFVLGPAIGIVLSYGYVVSSIVSFMLWWIATVSVLRHYSEKSRRKMYWFIFTVPLVYFLIQFQPLFLSLFSSILASQPVLFSIIYTLVFTLSKPLGGILFGIAFWTIARKLTRNNNARNYMVLSAYGLILSFVSNQAIVLVSAPYPPFGLVTTSFMGISSYLVLVGIYSAATSVAEDSELRQTIRKVAVKEAKLLDSIGTALMENELQRRIIKLTKEQKEILTQQTGIEPSLDEDQVKQYIVEVIKEIKNSIHD
jgi:hypothetical protein